MRGGCDVRVVRVRDRRAFRRKGEWGWVSEFGRGSCVVDFADVLCLVYVLFWIIYFKNELVFQQPN